MDELQRQKMIQELEKKIAELPVGYISKKTINGKIQYYHQWTEGGKKRSQYLRDGRNGTTAGADRTAQIPAGAAEGVTGRNAKSASAQAGF